jgi:hypothetical protein
MGGADLISRAGRSIGARLQGFAGSVRSSPTAAQPVPQCVVTALILSGLPLPSVPSGVDQHVYQASGRLPEEQAQGVCRRVLGGSPGPVAGVLHGWPKTYSCLAAPLSQ